jgi:trigger factor
MNRSAKVADGRKYLQRLNQAGSPGKTGKTWKSGTSKGGVESVGALDLCEIVLTIAKIPVILRGFWHFGTQLSGCGGIGRRARFRIWYRKVWGFESLHPHFKSEQHKLVSTLEITKENTGDLLATITVNVAPDDYRDEVRKILKDYGKRVNLKGFRKGKVPMSVMKKMFGKGVIVEELNKIISRELENYIKAEEMVLVGEPLPVSSNLELESELDKEYTLSYEVGLAPEFSIDYGLAGQASYYTVTIDDEVLAKEIADMQKRYGPMTNPEESQEGDILFGKVSEVDGDGNVVEDGLSRMVALNPDRIEDEDLKTEMGKTHKPEDTFPVTMKQIYPRAADLRQFWETNVQNEKVRDVSDDELEEIMGKSFVFEVKKINRMEPIEIGQEFFDKIFGEGNITTEEEFRERVSNDMDGFFNNEAQKYYRSKTIKALIEGIDIPLPEDFLKRFLVRTREAISEDNVAEVMESYLRSLRWRLIVEKMQKSDDSMTVEEDDLREKAEEKVLAQFGGMVGEDKARLDQFVNYYLQQENMVQEIFDEVLEDRVFAHLAQENPPAEESITATAFMEMLKAEAADE